ncbi:hypothetical protein PRUPE_5G097300 [Prunus persica]|uniref:PREDICTED: O-glucosyltransferase n=2 Tax=Prunus TaxID=3754 RepID=A0A5E4FRF5_PRUDU|nr:uncharacterized protein LOC18777628 isoform X1 [Prunus persica]ONI07048.1 hypothetical protein PRUPE_5G097300 [Prunus persica]VVA30071.1 PREDICTED: O-glucosyltransferase [Prunus dulcis]
MLRGSRLVRPFQFQGTSSDWLPSSITKSPAIAAATNTILFLGLFIISAAILFSYWIQISNFQIGNSANETILISNKYQEPFKVIEFPLNCSIGSNINQTQTCPTSYPTTFGNLDDLEPSSSPICPDYFRFIHQDLMPWKATGITRDMVERAKETAHFRLVIVKGKAYVEKYKKSIQTRDVFTIWGILQLLRRYPGRLPDLELMFDCDDKPVIRSRDFRGPNSTQVPPLFRYCGDRWTKDIVFPDWSFWGWAEINIKPWEGLLKDLKKGNDRRKWMEREPYAYWKGNPFVAESRKDLLKCNVSDSQDWNARLFIQDWILESQQGFKQSDVASQCTHRYKIYIEGYAWSVSEKYILACDSVTLIVKPQYYDFFTRSLQPVHHYWPIRHDDKCKSIKFAVDWGNNHKQKANAASGMAVHDDCKLKFLELKAKRNYRFILFKIEQQQIVIDKLGEPNESYDDFTSSFPADECRYAVFDFDFTTEENCQKSKIFFIAWSPDSSKVRMKMVYASSKDRFKRELDGISFELQATDPSEMSLDIVKGRVF